VTIPADIRERAGLLPHTEVEFKFDGHDGRRALADLVGGSGRACR
jgi:bifunctional DNA-binding transcriptional regulator/antitoxin component of YhaV-PrlF toxin-antitoxin module